MTKLKPWVTAVFFTASELVRRDIIAKDKSPLVPLSCCRPRIFTARKNMFDLATGEVFTVRFVFYFCNKPFAYSTCRLGEKKNGWRFGNLES